MSVLTKEALLGASKLKSETVDLESGLAVTVVELGAVDYIRMTQDFSAEENEGLGVMDIVGSWALRNENGERLLSPREFVTLARADQLRIGALAMAMNWNEPGDEKNDSGGQADDSPSDSPSN